MIAARGFEPGRPRRRGTLTRNVAAIPDSDRARAQRLRTRLQAGLEIDADDAAWVEAYDARPGKRGPQFAASRKTRLVHHVEESDESVVAGQSAASWAASAAFAREDGRRLDSIVDRGITALCRAVDTYEKMTLALLRERQADAVLHRALLESVRTHYLERTEAEAALIRAESAPAEPDETSGVESAIVQALIKNGFGGDKPQRKPPNGSSGAEEND